METAQSERQLPKEHKQQPLHVAAKASKVIQKWYFFINFFFLFPFLLSRIGTLEGSPCEASPSIMPAGFPQRRYWRSKLEEAHIR